MPEGALIGKGRTAEVYEWGDGKILKLYYDWYRPEWITQEERIGEALKESGVPAPQIYESCELEGRIGLVYERIDGRSMLSRIMASPAGASSCARAMARLHVQIHRCTTDRLPGQKEELEQLIQQSRPLLQHRTDRICEILRTLPDGQAVCHGDFHPDNVLVQESQSFAIDWTNANMGHPLCDVARTSLMFLSPYLPEGTPKAMGPLMKLSKRLLNRAYLREYCKLSGADLRAIRSWVLPVAAARLRENVPGEEKWLLALIDKGLAAAKK